MIMGPSRIRDPRNAGLGGARPSVARIKKKLGRLISTVSTWRPYDSLLSGPGGPEPALGRLSMNTTTGILGQMRLLWAFGRA